MRKEKDFFDFVIDSIKGFLLMTFYGVIIGISYTRSIRFGVVMTLTMVVMFATICISEILEEKQKRKKRKI